MLTIPLSQVKCVYSPFFSKYKHVSDKLSLLVWLSVGKGEEKDKGVQGIEGTRTLFCFGLDCSMFFSNVLSN